MFELCTPYLWFNIPIFVAGLVFLIKGSDLFIESAACIAKKYNVSEMTIGLTLVSIGTSLPEWASSLYAAFANEPEFIVGNIVGSITTNITLVLGLGIVLCSCMEFSRKLLTRDAVIMFGIFILTIILVLITEFPSGDHGINRWGGLLLGVLAVIYCRHLFKQPEPEVVEAEQEEVKALTEATKDMSFIQCFSLLLLGLAMVVGGSKAMLDTVVWSAEKLEISTIVISATIVAFGTSVPELAVTISGVVKNRHDMAIGNVIGSNTFNILLIFGSCSLVRPMEIGGITGMINLGIMLTSGIALLTMMYIGKNRLSRINGIILLCLYLCFLGYNSREVFL